MSRLKETYQNEIVDAMMKKFGYKNIMEVPKLDKVDRKSTRLNSSHSGQSRMPSSA